MLTRKHKWDSQHFGAWITDIHLHPQPFVWGERDCCLLAADGILSFTGVDIASDFRGKYTDQKSAFKLIKKVTGGVTVADAAAYCASKHGLEEFLHPLFARRGDLVVAKNGDGNLVAGIVSLNGRDVISQGETGPMKLSISQVVRAWKTHTHASSQPKTQEQEQGTVTPVLREVAPSQK